MRREVASPDCPHCGCNATELVAANMRHGRPWCVFRCDHCTREFSLGQVPVRSNGTPYKIPHPQLACPRCGRKKRSDENWQRSSPASRSGVKMRYLTCPQCSFPFATYEEAADAA